MNINPVNNGMIFNEKTYNKKAAGDNTAKPTDKLEISNKAMEISKAENPDKLTAIKNKIQSNFYNSDTVISAVAEKILKEIEF